MEPELKDPFTGKRIYRFFSKQELACPCCGKVDMDLDFMLALNKLRESYGKPLYVSSGYRCKKHNTKIKGHHNSAHMQGKAIDLKTYGIASTARAISDRASDFIGIEIGTKHVHLDMAKRSKKVIWSGTSK